MPTTLLDGLKLKNNSTELYSIVETVSKAIQEQYQKEIKPLIAKEIFDIVDNQSKRREYYPTITVFKAAENNWKKEQQLLKGDNKLKNYLQFSIVFGKSNQNNILAYPIFKNYDYKKALLNTGLFDSYSYGRNLDKPDNVSNSEWLKRGEEWQSIMSKDHTLSNLPLWELQNSNEIFSKDLLNYTDYNQYLTPEERLTNLLHEKVMKSLEKNVSTSFSHNNTAKKVVNRFVQNNSTISLEKLETPFIKLEKLPKIKEMKPEIIKNLRDETLTQVNI